MIFDWDFAHPERVHLVWLAIAIAGGLFALELRSRTALSAFLSPVMQRRLTAQASPTRVIVKLVLVLAAMLAAVFAVMRPQARGVTETVTTSRHAADVMFALDVSRSMLAEDTAPNRFARAKAEIGQLVSRLDGHRVGLIAFAGRAAPMCPLTPDHSFFRTVLATVDTRSAGRGGTRIGEAIKAALRGFPAGPGAKLIVLISDGDDQDPYSEEAAKAARDAGVKIITVGLGSEDGTQITLTDPQTGAKTTLMHEGAPVISKLNGEQLRKVALITEGAYIPAGTSAIDLDSIMESHVQPIVKQAADSAVRVIPAERYPWFVLASLACLLAALWVGAGAGERRAA
ncbi:MAG: VWA domain-containing protein [Deltaproteobacteria bacterium]|nr:VWA domain-containing protein [Deltaproteobacteria bacterium]MDQ3297798.1 VWA domain-containing protein [Myxococcota bacterium]